MVGGGVPAGAAPPTMTTGSHLMHMRFVALLGLATLLWAGAPAHAQDGGAQAPPVQTAPAIEEPRPASEPTATPAPAPSAETAPGAAPAQATPAAAAPPTGQPVPEAGQPARLPRPGSPPLVRFIELQ